MVKCYYKDCNKEATKSLGNGMYHYCDYHLLTILKFMRGCNKASTSIRNKLKKVQKIQSLETQIKRIEKEIKDLKQRLIETSGRDEAIWKEYKKIIREKIIAREDYIDDLRYKLQKVKYGK